MPRRSWNGNIQQNTRRNLSGFVSAVLVLICLLSPAKGETPRGYFQQEVHYHISVRLRPELVRLEGNETLSYVNRSPDTLRSLYFHLYWNKFRAHSYARPFSPRERGSMEILSIKDGAGEELSFSVDNTILRLPLPSPLAPGDSLQLHLKFAGMIPPSGERFGYSGDHFDIGNWYPVPAVYDARGWHIDQHLEGEFYQEWGDYDVRITVPRPFVVAATGRLLNPEALPDSVTSPGRTIQYYLQPKPDTATVTYHFRAEQVHDFAFCADPEFVLKQVQVGHTTLQFFLQPYRLKTWNNILEKAVAGFSFLEEKIGPYPYPQLSIVDGLITAGGIEYPNLVIINGYIIQPRELAITIVHEMGHQWFYGLLANNQTRYGWMDEGFTSFFEIWATEYLWGKGNNLNRTRRRGWERRLGYNRNARREAYLNYLEYALSGREESIDTHFDYFKHNPFIPTYDKMAVGLFTLKHLIGDSLFLKAIRTYYHTWRFRHPYPEDLFFVFNRATSMQLNWFWDQWLRTTWMLDVRLRRAVGQWVEREGRRQYRLTLVLERKQPLAMPVDVAVVLKNGARFRYRIPVPGWLPQPDSTDLASWHPANQRYVTRLYLPAPVRHIQLDPDGKLPDVNPFNNDNHWWPPLAVYWLHRQYEEPHLRKYTTTLFPQVFFNDVDGFLIGVRSVGNFVDPLYRHQLETQLGHRSGAAGVVFNWSSLLPLGTSRWRYHVFAYRLEGRAGGELAVSYRTRTQPVNHRFQLGWQLRHLYDARYPARGWSPGTVSVLAFEWFRHRSVTAYRRLVTRWQARVEVAAPGSDYHFQRWTFVLLPQIVLSPETRLNLRLAVGQIQGSAPLEYLFYPSGAAPVREFSNAFTRSRGTVPVQWVRNGHFRLPGGGQVSSAEIEHSATAVSGRRLLAGRISLAFGNPLSRLFPEWPVLPALQPAVYAAWSQLNWKKITRRSGHAELGFTLYWEDVPFLLRYLGVRDVKLTLPIWYSRPAPGNRPWKLRWALAVGFTPFR